MPLARYAMYSQQIQLYLAPTWDSGEPWLSTLRHIAKEGGVYVIGCCIAMRAEDVPETFDYKRRYLQGVSGWINPGDSVIVNPEGNIIAGPAHETQTILYAEVDPACLARSKWLLDVAGHYDRPDVFKLRVNYEIS